MLGNPSGGDVIGELLDRIVRVRDTDSGGSGNGNNGRRGDGGDDDRRDPFGEMSRALLRHMHKLHKGFAEHILGLVSALVLGHAELKDENKELRRQVEALEKAGERKDVEP